MVVLMELMAAAGPAAVLVAVHRSVKAVLEEQEYQMVQLGLLSAEF